MLSFQRFPSPSTISALYLFFNLGSVAASVYNTIYFAWTCMPSDMPFTPPSVSHTLQTRSRWLPKQRPHRPPSPSDRNSPVVANRPVPQDVGLVPMEEELAIRNQCLDNALREGLFPAVIRL